MNAQNINLQLVVCLAVYCQNLGSKLIVCLAVYFSLSHLFTNQYSNISLIYNFVFNSKVIR
ncbi:MAG: hypothetical protein ACK49X_14375, partial [Akkermansiaceae bacterium]